MFKFIGIIGNLLGIGGNFLQNKAKLKELKQVQEHEIVKAETGAIVKRINSNTDSDNQIDLITARNKKHTFKDEIITYVFLTPVLVATATPFIIAYQESDWVNILLDMKESYEALDQLPTWYKYVLFAIVVDVLGFRSFARKIVDRYHTKQEIKLKKSAKA